MTRYRTFSSMVLALGAVAASSAFAQARSLSIDAPHAQLTMAQAVVIAESTANGRATEARLDQHAAQPVYKVTVKSAQNKSLDMEVAATGGRIVAGQRTKGPR